MIYYDFANNEFKNDTWILEIFERKLKIKFSYKFLLQIVSKLSLCQRDIIEMVRRD